MEKNIIIVSVLCLVLLGGILVLSFDKEEDTFDVCQEQETFGLKYQNCDTIECAKFHEDIKEQIRLRNCN